MKTEGLNLLSPLLLLVIEGTGYPGSLGNNFCKKVPGLACKLALIIRKMLTKDAINCAKKYDFTCRVLGWAG